MSPPSDEIDAPTMTYVVRLWYEAGGGNDCEGEWRGQVREVPGGRTAYFRSIDGVVAAMKRLAGVSGGGCDEPRRSS